MYKLPIKSEVEGYTSNEVIPFGLALVCHKICHWGRVSLTVQDNELYLPLDDPLMTPLQGFSPHTHLRWHVSFQTICQVICNIFLKRVHHSVLNKNTVDAWYSISLRTNQLTSPVGVQCMLQPNWSLGVGVGGLGLGVWGWGCGGVGVWVWVWGGGGGVGVGVWVWGVGGGVGVGVGGCGGWVWVGVGIPIHGKDGLYIETGPWWLEFSHAGSA